MKNIVKWMFILALASILGSMLSSCALTKQQRTDNRVIKKIEKIKAKYPESFSNVTTETVRIDTFIPEIDHSGDLRVVVDSSAVDSLTSELQTLLVANDSLSNIPQTSGVVDSLSSELKALKLAEAIRTAVTKYAPSLIKIDILDIDTLGVKARIWYDKDQMVLNYQFHKDSTHITASKDVNTINITPTEVIYKIPWYIWIIIVALSLTTLLVFLKK